MFMPFTSARRRQLVNEFVDQTVDGFVNELVDKSFLNDVVDNIFSSVGNMEDIFLSQIFSLPQIYFLLQKGCVLDELVGQIFFE